MFLLILFCYIWTFLLNLLVQIFKETNPLYHTMSLKPFCIVMNLNNHASWCGTREINVPVVIHLIIFQCYLSFTFLSLHLLVFLVRSRCTFHLPTMYVLIFPVAFIIFSSIISSVFSLILYAVIACSGFGANTKGGIACACSLFIYS